MPEKITFFSDFLETFSMLPKDKGYDFIKACLEYANGIDPIIDDLTVNVLFSEFKSRFEREKEHLKAVSEAKSHAGQKSGEARRAKKAVQDKQNEHMLNSLNTSEQNEPNNNNNSNNNDHTPPPYSPPPTGDNMENFPSEGVGGHFSGDEKEKSSEPVISASVDPDFDILWSAYPKHNGKEQSYEQWKLLADSGDLPSMDVLLAKIALFKNAKTWQKADGQYIPLLKNFLSKRMWELDLADDQLEPTFREKKRQDDKERAETVKKEAEKAEREKQDSDFENRIFALQRSSDPLDRIKYQISLALSPTLYRLWIEPSKLELKDSELRIYPPNDIIVDLLNKYRKKMSNLGVHVSILRGASC